MRNHCVNHLIKILSKICEYVSIILVFVSNESNLIYSFSQIIPVNSILKQTNAIMKRAKILDFNSKNNVEVTTKTNKPPDLVTGEQKFPHKVPVNAVEKNPPFSTISQNIIEKIKTFPNLNERSKTEPSKHSYKHNIIITDSHTLRERVRSLSTEKLNSVR